MRVGPDGPVCFLSQCTAIDAALGATAADLDEWVPPGEFDVYVVGMQENSQKKAWLRALNGARLLLLPLGIGNSRFRMTILDFDAPEPEILKSRRSEAGNLEIRKLRSQTY